MRRLSLLCLCWFSATALAQTNPERSAYLELPSGKAMARAVGTDNRIYTSSSQANELAAANAALARCQQQATARQACELVWLNDEQLTTGATLRAALPQKPHPLFLWRYAKGDSTLYLAGSVHLLKPSTYPLPQPLEDAFEQSSNLVLEVNLEALDNATLQRAVQERALLKDGSKLEEHLTPELKAQLEQQLERYGIDITAVAQLKPAAITQQLVMLRLLTLGYPNNSGVEQHFLSKLNHRSVQGLETIEEQLDLLLNQPMPVQLAMLRETLDQFDHAGEQMRTMISAWLVGDDTTILAEFTSQAGSGPEAKRFYEQLLDDRNLKMTRKIQKLLDVPGTHMVLVGAAHCPGDKGIVNLLAEQGFQGERLWSNQQVLQVPGSMGKR